MIGDLGRLLGTLSEGPVAPERREEVLALLAQDWDMFEGGSDSQMRAYKVDRAEDLTWEPPVLSFIVERHGGASLGSTRAELQVWRVNVEEGTASWGPGGHRQLTPAAPRWDQAAARAAAKNVADAMRNGRREVYLVWTQDGRRVRVLPRGIVPDGPAQTLAGRSRRLAEALVEELGADGWVRRNGGWWDRP